MRDLDRSLGDGGMPLLGTLGLDFDAYGSGWATARWTPSEAACNPLGTVHGGVYGVVHDAAMNFATSAALESGDRCATLDITYATLRPARAGETLTVRGSVIRVSRTVAWVECTIVREEELVSKASATFSVRRAER